MVNRMISGLLVLLLAGTLAACGDEEEQEITPYTSSQEEVEEDYAVSTSEEDGIEPLEGASFDYSMKSNWLHLPGMDLDEDEEEAEEDGEEPESEKSGEDGEESDEEEESAEDGDEQQEESEVEGRMEAKSARESGSAGDLQSAPLKDVDTIYIYPSVYMDVSPDAPEVQEAISKEEREAAREAYERQATAFEQSTNVFAPYYRQTNLTEYAELDKNEVEAFQMGQQRTDLYAALDYYFTNYNEDRPFILAGHSQGAMMVKIILKEYMDAHPELYERMVCAYVIGWSVTEDDLLDCDYLKFAEDSEDTGVVISWNTEGKKNGDNYVLLEDALCINPISWNREPDKVPASENLGSRIYNEEEDRYEIRTNLADAAIDEKRGSIICKTKAVEYDKVPGDILGKKSYHSHDFDLYYENIRDNVRERTESYLYTYDNTGTSEGS